MLGGVDCSCFNPRSRKGATGDCTLGACFELPFQSALPQRSDPFSVSKNWTAFCFNPRSRKGATLLSTVNKALGASFNPRSRKGATAPQHKTLRPCGGFNPRSRKGATVEGACILAAFLVSIRAPAKERPVLDRIQNIINEFQSALPQRSDL